MYSTGLGHGDAQHVGDLDPSRPGLEVYSCHEDTNSKYSYEMRDARTGEILVGGEQMGGDNGRGTSDDIALSGLRRLVSRRNTYRRRRYCHFSKIHYASKLPLLLGRRFGT